MKSTIISDLDEHGKSVKEMVEKSKITKDVLDETTSNGVNVSISREGDSQKFGVRINALDKEKAYYVDVPIKDLLSVVERGKKMDDVLNNIIEVCNKEHESQKRIAKELKEIKDQEKISKLLSFGENQSSQEKFKTNPHLVINKENLSKNSESEISYDIAKEKGLEEIANFLEENQSPQESQISLNR